MNPKLILTTVLLLLCMFGCEIVSAQTLVIWQKDGSKVSFELDEQPKTTFVNDNLVITTTNGAISFPMEKVSRYTYDGVQLSVRNIKRKETVFAHEGDMIIVKGIEKGQSVAVFSTDGIKLFAKRSDGSESLSLPINNFPPGTYIIKANELSFKYLKR